MCHFMILMLHARTLKALYWAELKTWTICSMDYAKFLHPKRYHTGCMYFLPRWWGDRPAEGSPVRSGRVVKDHQPLSVTAPAYSSAGAFKRPNFSPLRGCAHIMSHLLDVICLLTSV